MSNSLKSTLWWIFAIIFTIAIASYQRMTGPTYPVKGKTALNGKTIQYQLIRTAETGKDAEISISVHDTAVKGTIVYKRFKSHDSLIHAAMTRAIDTAYFPSFGNMMKMMKHQPRDYKLDTTLKFMMPQQPAAGKMQYSIELSKQQEKVNLTDKPVVMRFKGPVPAWVLIPHILLMFLAMLFSTRAGIEAIRRGKRTYLYALMTLIFFIPGGLILGPVVQKFAFDAYWTGWPFGHDLTDNKTALAVLGWLIAVIKLRKNPTTRGWVIAAAIILLVVYMVPHSVLGSEIDYTQQPK